MPLKRLEALLGCPALLGAAVSTAEDPSAAQEGPEFMAMDGAALENLEVCCTLLWRDLLLLPWTPVKSVRWLLARRPENASPYQWPAEGYRCQNPCRLARTIRQQR